MRKHSNFIGIFCFFAMFSGVTPTWAENAAQMPKPADFTINTAPVQVVLSLQCSFKSECYETESCSDTTFSFDLDGRAGGFAESDMVVQVDLSSEIGDTALIGARSGEAMSLAGGTFETRHLLTINQAGAARYTLHYAEGPMAISYFGDCK